MIHIYTLGKSSIDLLISLPKKECEIVLNKYLVEPNSAHRSSIQTYTYIDSHKRTFFGLRLEDSAHWLIWSLCAYYPALWVCHFAWHRSALLLFPYRDNAGICIYDPYAKNYYGLCFCKTYLRQLEFPKIPSRNLTTLSLAYEMDFGRHLKSFADSICH